jgi:DNA-binding YbaB/EbfC family protein
MQSQMMAFQEKVKTCEVTGTAGGGMVAITLSGQGPVTKTLIDASLLNVEEKEVLEDLICAAFADARQKMEARTSEEMGKITGGLQLPPGLNFPGM